MTEEMGLQTLQWRRRRDIRTAAVFHSQEAAIGKAQLPMVIERPVRRDNNWRWCVNRIYYHYVCTVITTN